MHYNRNTLSYSLVSGNQLIRDNWCLSYRGNVCINHAVVHDEICLRLNFRRLHVYKLSEVIRTFSCDTLLSMHNYMYCMEMCLPNVQFYQFCRHVKIKVHVDNTCIAEFTSTDYTFSKVEIKQNSIKSTLILLIKFLFYL